MTTRRAYGASALIAAAMVVGYLLLLPMLQSLAAQPDLPRGAAPAVASQTVTILPIRAPVVVTKRAKKVPHHPARRRAHTASHRAATTAAPGSGPPSSAAPISAPSNNSSPSSAPGLQVLSATGGALSGTGSPGLNTVCQGSGCP